MLRDLLMHNGGYALALGPGFFCFYAHCGVLSGALIGSLISCGLSPSQIIPKILRLKREDCWDAGQSLFGLLKGDLFKQELEKNFPNGIRKFEELKVPFAVSVWELLRFRTKIIASGDLATAVVGACCVPLLFAPIMIDGTPCVDGGFFDEAGIMGLPGVPETNLVVNIVCSGQAVSSSIIPPHFGNNCRLLTMVMENIPNVNPFSMQEQGPVAFETARLATLNAFSNGHLQQLHQRHWVTYIDGLRVQNENLQAALLRQELLLINTDDGESWQDDVVNRSFAPLPVKLKEPPQIRPFHFLEESFKHARKRHLGHSSHHHHHHQDSPDQSLPNKPVAVVPSTPFSFSPSKKSDSSNNVDEIKEAIGIENSNKRRRKLKDDKDVKSFKNTPEVTEKQTHAQTPLKSRSRSSKITVPSLSSPLSKPTGAILTPNIRNVSTTRVTRSSAVKESKQKLKKSS